MNKNSLIDECLELYEMSLIEFAKKYDLKESTLKQWRKSLPIYGKLLLEQMIENYKLKKDKEEKAELITRLKKLVKEL
jgi:hypothetical protein